MEPRHTYFSFPGTQKGYPHRTGREYPFTKKEHKKAAIAAFLCVVLFGQAF